MSETRPCPKCGRQHQIKPLIENAWQKQCECGAKLRLEWERTETDKAPKMAIGLRWTKRPNDQALPQGGAKKGNDEH